MMNGSLNDTDTVQDGRMDNFTIGVGIGYICTGIIFIFLQLACAYLIMKKKQVRNPTYMLVVNLSICDALTLVSVAVYCGITILLDHEHATLTRWMTAVAMSGWYTNCILFVYISFSRWIAITRSHLVDQMFTAGLTERHTIRMEYSTGIFTPPGGVSNGEHI